MKKMKAILNSKKYELQQNMIQTLSTDNWRHQNLCILLIYKYIVLIDFKTKQLKILNKY